MTDESPGNESALLLPAEQQILALVDELVACITELVDETDERSNLAEFDQRLLLEHAQVIERYVLAQAAARAYPGRYRLIGKPAPGWDDSAGVSGHSEPERAKGVTHDRPGHASDGHTHHDHQHDHEGAGPQAHSHAPEQQTTREMHRQGRAVIGEHPWEHEHGGEPHSHDDEWEPLDGDGEAR